MLNLKLTKAPHFMQVENNEDSERRRLEQLELLSVVDDGRYHAVKITTNILDIKYDRKDQRLLSAINSVKLIYKMANGGSLILIGNLGCSFRQPFGGEFFVKKVVVEENTVFDNIVGAFDDVMFSNYPIDIPTMQDRLARISKDSNLVFNLSVFDEFMEIFEFYKALSSELNNNTHYSIESISRPHYLFLSIKKRLKLRKNMLLKIKMASQSVTNWKIKDLVLEDEHNNKLCYNKEKIKERVEYQQKKFEALLTSYKYDERRYAIS